MSQSGTCPRCGESIAIATPAPTLLVCAACEQRCMVLLTEPEEATAEGGMDVELVPYVEADREDSPTMSGIKHGAFFGLLAVGTLAALPVVLMVLLVLVVIVMLFASAARFDPAPEASPGTVAAVGLSLIGVFVVAVAVGVIRLLFARRRA